MTSKNLNWKNRKTVYKPRPFLLQPACKEALWGGQKLKEHFGKKADLDNIAESWECSTHPEGPSTITTGEHKGMLLTEVLQRYPEYLGTHPRSKGELPILVKFIDARQKLSVQVHPDDEYAKLYERGQLGKTEMWYVVDADKGAKLRSGFSEQITPKEYKERVLNNTITDVLQEYEIHPGDVFFLPAGRVHSIGAGAFIAEIQQTSDITYRIYDFNRKDANGKTRELHTDLAREAINYEVLDDYRTKYEPLKDEPVELVACPYFTTSLYDMTEEISCDYSELDSFVIFICMEGSCKMVDNEGNELTVNAGESILLPATTQDITITPESANVKLLETYV